MNTWRAVTIAREERHHLFFLNDTATTEIYTLSLHDALPISDATPKFLVATYVRPKTQSRSAEGRSEEHTSELQSRGHLVCRLLLEKKKNFIYHSIIVFNNTKFLL